MRVTNAVSGLLALMLLAFPSAARASFIYTFESTDATHPYSFSFTFPTALVNSSVAGNSVVPVPFTVEGITFLDAALTPGWVAFSPTANSLNLIGPNAGAIQFSNPVSGMVITPTDDIAIPGVYTGPFFQIFNTTTLPYIDKITVIDTSATPVPEPTSLMLLASGVASVVGWRRLRGRKSPKHG